MNLMMVRRSNVFIKCLTIMQEFTKCSKCESTILYEILPTFGNFSSSTVQCNYFAYVGRTTSHVLQQYIVVNIANIRIN